MGRPRKDAETVVHQVKLVLTVGEDDDLIAQFDRVPARAKAAMVKARMRSGLEGAVVEDEAEDAGLYALLGSLVL